MTATPNLTIIIPALNEQENLRLLLPQIHDVLNDLAIEFEVIVVDGGSRDETQQVASAAGARIVEQTVRGYGGAPPLGVCPAQTPFLGPIDGCLSHTPVGVEGFLRE